MKRNPPTDATRESGRPGRPPAPADRQRGRPGRPPLPRLSTFRALRHPDYRLFWTGQVVSLTGTWMQTTAQSWLVYDLSRSAFMLGVVGLASSLPVLVFSIGGGVIADRIARRRLLMISNGAALVQALLMAALVYSGHAQVWHIVALAFLLGLINALDSPARLAFVSEMVPPDDLMNAVALNSIAFNTARIAGPALAGALAAVAGINICFLLNAVSFVPILVGLWLMRLPDVPAATGPSTPLGDVREALRHIFHHRETGGLLGLTALSSLFAFPFVLLMPVVAREMLGLDVRGYGGLLSATGVGALIGAGTLATFGKRIHRGRFLYAGTLMLPVSLIVLALSRSYPLSLLALVGAGWGMIAQNVTANTILQTSTPEVLRGRVMSVFTLALMGLVPLGTLQAGTVAEHLGAPAALGGGAVVFALGAWLIHRAVPEIRRR